MVLRLVIPTPRETVLHSLIPSAHVFFSFFLFLFSHRTNTPRKQGGLGTMKIPLVSDTRRTISTDYGVLKEDEGIAYRWVGLMELLVIMVDDGQ